MARRESDLVKADNWQFDGLYNMDHGMAVKAAGWLRGKMTAETTEEVRKRIAVMQGLDISPKPTSDSAGRETARKNRESVNQFLDDPANEATVAAIRIELRDTAQAQFNEGTYGDPVARGGSRGPRGPAADPPRVAALWAFLVELNQAKAARNGGEFNPDDYTRNDRIANVMQFEQQYGGSRGKYRDKIAELTAHLASPKGSELLGDL